jgi:hypothetical protein
MPDREKIIKGLTACRKTFCESCPYNATDVKNTNPICLINEMLSDAIDLLKEQEAEIAFLKAMQLQTVHNMSNEDIGNAVRNVLRL